MEYRQCGYTDLKLSVIGTGCWAFGGGEYWGPNDQSDTNAVVRAAVEAGINYFDTAEAYNEGRSERSLGEAIRDIPRDKVLLGSKISPSHCYPDLLERHCEASLKRLGTDYLDLYMIHWPIHPHSIRHFTKDESVINHPPLLEEALARMETLKQKGMIRELGISNFSRARMQDIPAKIRIAANELPYNLLCRAIEFDTLPHCQKKGVGIIGYMTLLQGILTGLYRSLEEVPEWQRRTRHFRAAGSPLSRHGEDGFEEQTEKARTAVRMIAGEEGISLASLATRWVLANPAITCALIGARNTRKLEENIAAAEGRLSTDTLNRLDKVTDKLKNKMDAHFDYYESTQNDRTL
ncbi:MAG: aldo/keto reductase [Puia sp.]|nr:aldo/keto reductase [Puia sp.]